MERDMATPGNWFHTTPPVKEFFICKEDRTVLRDLAKRILPLAELPCQEEKAKIWTNHNDLKPSRPVVYCDPENGWREIIPWNTLQCHGTLARQWELYLRKALCSAEQIQDDSVLEPVFYLPLVQVSHPKWGIESHRYSVSEGGSYVWDPPLKEFNQDFEKLRYPVVDVDFENSRKLMELAEETFGGLLQVKQKHKWLFSVGLTNDYAQLRGLEQMFFDYYDYPEECHRLMRFLMEGNLHYLDQLEKLGVLNLNTGNTYVSSGGLGYTSQLPQPDFDPVHVRVKDMWGSMESQDTSSVSADLFAEFVLPYQIPLAERFGMVAYGCCEGLHSRWRYVKRVPNLRRISVSPWADTDKMAEYLGGDYVYSCKPSPSIFATPGFQPEEHRGFIRHVLETGLKNGCHVEFIMKDNETFLNHPENLFTWVKMVKEEINKVYGSNELK